MRTFILHKQNNLEVHTPLNQNSKRNIEIRIDIPNNWPVESNNFTESRLYGMLSKKAVYYKRKVSETDLVSGPYSHTRDSLVYFTHQYSVFVIRKLRNIKTDEDIVKFTSRVKNALEEFRSSERLNPEFHKVDEICTWLTEQKVLEFLKNSELYNEPLYLLLQDIDDYRHQHNYATDTFDPEVVDRLKSGLVILKSELATTKEVKELGINSIHLFAGFAAAIAMSFSMTATFAGYIYFGNLSSAFFAFMVISYIFKDRLKETIRNWAIKKFGAKHRYAYVFKDKQGNIPLLSREIVKYVNGRCASLVFGSYYSATSKMLEGYSSIQCYSTINLNSLLAYAPRSKMFYHKLTSKKKVKSEKAALTYKLTLTVTEENESIQYWIFVKNGKIDNLQLK
jgi:hypothetical protein